MGDGRFLLFLCVPKLSVYGAQIGFVAGDMRNPARDLPRVINTSMVTVIVGFVLVNTALYLVVPIQLMRETKTPVTVRNFSRKTH